GAPDVAGALPCVRRRDARRPGWEPGDAESGESGHRRVCCGVLPRGDCPRMCVGALRVRAAMLDAALAYAARGVPVFPVWPMRNGAGAGGDAACLSPGKHPMGGYAPHGFKSATTDVALIRQWWTKTPDANIATPTGRWCVVLDLDPRHQGDSTLASLEHRYGLLPSTAQVVTV